MTSFPEKVDAFPEKVDFVRILLTKLAEIVDVVRVQLTLFINYEKHSGEAMRQGADSPREINITSIVSVTLSLSVLDSELYIQCYCEVSSHYRT